MTDEQREDLAYFRRRAIQEEQAMRHAACHAARERHQELADAYHFRCRALGLLGSGECDVGAAPFVRLAPTRDRPMLAA